MKSVSVYLLEPGFQFYDIERMGNVLEEIANSSNGTIEVFAPYESSPELLSFWRGYFRF
jgi:hypothetical protein